MELHRATGSGNNFDIRAVGAIKAVLYCAGFFFLLVALRPLGRVYQTLVSALAL
jgi:hypothetical protein